MTPKQASAEIEALLAELEARGGTRASNELREFLASLSKKNERKTRLTTANDASPNRVARRPARDPVAMAKTIEELAGKLRTHFMSDANFEAAMAEVANSNLTKDNVVKLYNAVFETDRKFGKALSKPDLLNAIRRDRIARVRARS
jgi:hypothetical protein